jgi:vacuolar-type H+-ATPase subunit E/Vma4
MRKIVREILETESRIGEILQEARQKASEMKLAADKEASEQVAEARQQARGIVQAAEEEAKKESERIGTETLERAQQQADALLDGKAEAIDDLVTRICDVLLNVEPEMDGH